MGIFLGRYTIDLKICTPVVTQPGMAARTIVWADPSPRYTSMLLGCYAANEQQYHLLQNCKISGKYE